MSFGGGDSPSGTTFQTQFTRDAPQIEAAKMGLMGTAQQYARFGQNPWELSHPGAKVGEEGFGKYTQGAGGTYAEGTKWEDLTRQQRATEGQVQVPQQQVAGFNPMQEAVFGRQYETNQAGQPIDEQGNIISETDPRHWSETAPRNRSKKTAPRNYTMDRRILFIIYVKYTIPRNRTTKHNT